MEDKSIKLFPGIGECLVIDRLVSLFTGLDTICDVIAFPKNSSNRDVMIDSPSKVATEQLDELRLKLNLKDKE